MENPNFRFVKMDICDREAVFNLFEEDKTGYRCKLCGREPRGPFHRGSGHLPADQYHRYAGDDGRQPQVRRKTVIDIRIATKCTATCLWTARISSLRRRRRLKPAARTAPPRQEQTFWSMRTTGHLVCRRPFPDAPTTMDHISSRRS